MSAKHATENVFWNRTLPGDWEVKRVKHIARFTTGWTPPSKDAALYRGDNPWANIGDLGQRFLSDTANHISDEAVLDAGIPLSPEGSLLFSFKLSVGQVSIAGRPLFTNEAIASFAPQSGFEIRWAYYSFPHFIPENSAVNIYGAKLLNRQRIGDARLPVPPRDIQIRIADYLDTETERIDRLIQQKEEEITLLRELRASIISDALFGRFSNAATTKPRKAIGDSE